MNIYVYVYFFIVSYILFFGVILGVMAPSLMGRVHSADNSPPCNPDYPFCNASDAFALVGAAPSRCLASLNVGAHSVLSWLLRGVYSLPLRPPYQPFSCPPKRTQWKGTLCPSRRSLFLFLLCSCQVGGDWPCDKCAEVILLTSDGVHSPLCPTRRPPRDNYNFFCRIMTKTASLGFFSR